MERSAASNTKKWARASSEAPSKSEKVDIGEIEVGMSFSQKNDMLHAVAQKATQEELDARMKKEAVKTDDDIKAERYAQADEVSSESTELEKMSFKAKDMNAFTAMTAEHAEKSHPAPVSALVKAAQGPVKKDFFEQILDKSKTN